MWPMCPNNTTFTNTTLLQSGHREHGPESLRAAGHRYPADWPIQCESMASSWMGTGAFHRRLCDVCVAATKLVDGNIDRAVTRVLWALRGNLSARDSGSQTGVWT